MLNHKRGEGCWIWDGFFGFAIASGDCSRPAKGQTVAGVFSTEVESWMGQGSGKLKWNIKLVRRMYKPVWDGNETSGGYKMAVLRSNGIGKPGISGRPKTFPTLMAFSRQV